MRLRNLVKVNPPKAEIAHLPGTTEVTFAPMEAIFDGLGGLDRSLTRTLEDVGSGSYSYFADGDVLLAKVTPCFENGKKARASGLKNGIGFATSEVHVIRPDSRKIEPRYLTYLFSSEHFRAAGIASMTGAGGLRRVSEHAILNHRLCVTDLPTQKAIADFLDRETARIDQLIEKKEVMAALLDLKRSSTISTAVTRGVDSDVLLKETGSIYLPWIPSHWTLQRLKQLANVRGGITLGRTLPPGAPTREVPYLRVANVQAGWLDLANMTVIEVTDQEIQRYSLKHNDVLMNEGGDNDKLGRGAVWKEAIAPCLHQNHVFAVRPHVPDFAQWIALSSNTKYGREFFYLNSKQSTNLASIAKSRLEQFPVPLPPRHEREKILRYLSERLNRNSALKKSILLTIEKLREYRSSLITAAVTGEIEVVTWDKQGTTDRRLDAIEADLRNEREEAAV